MKIPNIYAKPYYKFYILIALVIFIAAATTLPNLKYGIDLRGGTQMSAVLHNEFSEAQIASHLEKYSLEDLAIRFTHNPLNNRSGAVLEFTGNTDLIEADKAVQSNPERAIALATPFITSTLNPGATARETVELARADFNRAIQGDLVVFLGVSDEEITTVEIGASLGQQFWDSSIRVLLIAFVLIAAIIFILFREPVPCIAVIQAAVYDITLALAGMSIFQIPITLPTIAGLLMILGHSVDTDIVTADRVLKRSEGNAAERTYGAMLTGLTMTGTILVVLAVLVTFSYFNQMTTLNQIALVLMFGLVGDIPSTWFVNAVMIKWWAERKKK